MQRSIGLVELEETTDHIAFSADSTAPRLTGTSVTLRFRLTSNDPESLEALRYARRAMLREEWTRGIEEGEPSLEDAIFSVFEVVWSVRKEQRELCRAKLDELVERANRALAELREARNR